MARGSSPASQLWVSSYLLLILGASSFRLPGVEPQEFRKGDELKVKLSKLTSLTTQLPYTYYSLEYCKPTQIVESTENLVEVLHGHHIENSPYVFKMQEPQKCIIVCRKTLNAKTAKGFKDKIDDEYRVNMILEQLSLVVPGGGLHHGMHKFYQHGFHIGFKGHYLGGKEETYYINNHLSFTIKFNRDTVTEAARIVGFEVRPFSVKHSYEGEWNDNNSLSTCDLRSKFTTTYSVGPQEVEDKNEIIFTYDVDFQESDVKWASRWDMFLLEADDQIQWFSIVSSLVMVLFLSGVLAMIMVRILYRGISKFHQLEAEEEAREEIGWELVHGDVFRPPANMNMLCIYVGTGVQLFGTTLVMMILAVLGFLSPSSQGALRTAMLLVWVFMGILAGYSSARLYKMFKGKEWKKITLRTAFIFPATVFAIFFILNALIWGEKSSGAVPFGTMFALGLLWFSSSVPLAFVGSHIGFKKPPIEDPVRTNKIPRQIPEQPWYLTPAFSILIGGILPFGAVIVELFFILTSIWFHQFFYVFGFHLIAFLVLTVTCAEITVIFCFFHLCSQDYRWWWRSYLTSGSSALYLFLYSTFYFFTRLGITKPVSVALYFGYMLIFSYAFFMFTGTIGFCACLWFTRLMYSSLKIE